MGYTENDRIFLIPAGNTMDATKLKVTLTISILCVGLLLPFIFHDYGGEEDDSIQGIVIDFSDMRATWVDVDLDIYDTGKRALEYACSVESYALSFDSDGNVETINGYVSDSTKTWTYWGILKGTTTWKQIGSDSDPADYTVTSWAYRSEGEIPTVAVDALGNCIYGHKRANSIVTMSASATEIIASLDATDSLVGVDQYSDYPKSVVDGRNDGTISVVGDYIGPSFELVMKCRADLVIGDDTDNSQSGVCRRLIQNGTPTVLLYDGVGIDDILNNIYIAGVVSGRAIEAVAVIDDIRDVLDTVSTMMASDPSVSDQKVLVTLSPDVSPYASAQDTYISDTLEYVKGKNVLDNADGWMKINSEFIADSEADKIIILVSKYDGKDYDYEEMLADLSEEWKRTPAYNNGEIYLVEGEAADLMQRCSPRVAQLVELLARMIQSSTFGAPFIVNEIGDDYTSYLNFSKDLSYDT